MEHDCPFCCLPPSALTWSSDLIVAIRDRWPVSPGHTLVLPRRHIPSYFEAGPMEQAGIWQAVHALKKLLDAQLSPAPDGYNIGFNTGVAAGQTVMHLHVHIIPRYSGDMSDPRGGVRGVIPAKQKYGRLQEHSESESSPSASALDAGVFADLPVFVPGQEKPLVQTLRRALQLAERADLISAFVQPSGLDLIVGDIEDALSRGARIRVLTGDYLRITSPDALRTLFALAEEHEGFQAWIFSTGGALSFHPKTYIFARGDEGVAFVGSSNLSGSGLGKGVEWNLRLVRSTDKEGFWAIRARFEALLSRPETEPLTRLFIDNYGDRVPIPPAPEPRAKPPDPHKLQTAALAALAQARLDGHEAGLVVMATGLGKTYLSAFDFQQLRGKRALFVAHREEILNQARSAWSLVFPNLVLGIFMGGQHEPNADVVFASIQTLARVRHLRRFAAEHFDYIVVDEFHHAAAASYRKLIGHFQPRFLLGLTATPDRTDGASLLELCGGNLVFTSNLVEGIARKLLVPFQYFGVRDQVDFTPIPWRSGRFDVAELTGALATRARAEQSLREYRRHAQAKPRRALVFCCSVLHADFMAGFFQEQGHPAAAVHSGPRSAPRAESLRRLRSGELEMICAVDVFNEGLDLPDINVVLMLRPTLSPIIFLQQLGRGLRRALGKSHLTIVDFIGNHRDFLKKPQALVYLSGRDLEGYAAVRALLEGKVDFPEGCSVDIETEALDMLAGLARVSKEDVLLYEYMSFRDTHGRRPSATELHGLSVIMKPVQQRYGDWFGFVQAQGDLSPEEEHVYELFRGWFGDLQRTQISASYKMLALQALLAADSLFTGMSIAANAAHALGLARKQKLLWRELCLDRERSELGPAMVAKWKEMPLKVWARGRGTSKPWFAIDKQGFRGLFDVVEKDREIFEALTGELVDLRVAQHLEKLRKKLPLDAGQAPIRMRVSHAGQKPILRFDRKARPDIPDGETPVLVDDNLYVFHFRKIAVNVVRDQAGGGNLLHGLMRRWFGLNAGLPGTRHYVLLEQTASGWRLRQETQQLSTPVSVVRPALPYFRELRVACGAFHEGAPLVEQAERLHVETDRKLSPSQHFVVRAEGDSMDGGPAPIRDGDLVLCAWHQPSSTAEISGRPWLLVGHETADSSFAVIKVPRKTSKGWLLESWNPQHPVRELPAAVRVEPVARVLEVVRETEGLVLWGRYDRDAAAQAFGEKNNPAWKVGHRDLMAFGKPHTVLFVTLRKDDQTRVEHRYADRFVARDELHWESQASTTPGGAKGRRIIGHAAEGRAVHLFVRYRKRMDFVYCGTLTYLRHEGERPMKVWFRLERELPEGLWEVWGV